MRALSSIFFSGAALVNQVTAGVRSRTPATHLVASHVLVLISSANNTSELAALGDGCPIGWAPCSLTTCYPLDGAECCSDGNFCPAGYLCQDGGCCPSGEICVGSSGPPITIGGGDNPTETGTSIPTTTRHTTTTTTRHTFTATSTSTTITFNVTTGTDIFTSTTTPATTHTATTVMGAGLTTTSSTPFASVESEPTAGASGTPLSGAVNGAMQTMQKQGTTAILALILGIATNFA
ncbi:hypothetical protein PYCCODRAFT_1476751 [Trametes coccinea BRFM310]|uniref:GPI anchored serine-threonine rich protein n=1 Tax=Trametes coccinea (strain BRFM310) TaxID=1353009 RepID=A0A1Y2IRT3_TRAC3|nr:hypothetical protein PYCCODRAFT_1476751 [Trametes coccinea BRFM310]